MLPSLLKRGALCVLSKAPLCTSINQYVASDPWSSSSHVALSGSPHPPVAPKRVLPPARRDALAGLHLATNNKVQDRFRVFLEGNVTRCEGGTKYQC